MAAVVFAGARAAALVLQLIGYRVAGTMALASIGTNFTFSPSPTCQKRQICFSKFNFLDFTLPSPRIHFGPLFSYFKHIWACNFGCCLLISCQELRELRFIFSSCLDPTKLLQPPTVEQLPFGAYLTFKSLSQTSKFSFLAS
jgi:hypothetical protein